jgi:hypothetical protein
LFYLIHRDWIIGHGSDALSDKDSQNKILLQSGVNLQELEVNLKWNGGLKVTGILREREWKRVEKPIDEEDTMQGRRPVLPQCP